jgi:hypothetical protein
MENTKIYTEYEMKNMPIKELNDLCEKICGKKVTMSCGNKRVIITQLILNAQSEIKDN